MGKFSEYIKTNVEIKETESITRGEKVEQIEDLLDRYSRLNREELMAEFLRESNRLKQNGGLNDEQVNSIESVLKPHLNETQQNMFDSLMTEIKNEK